VDDKAAHIGSVNFAKAGFWQNYETRIKLIEPEVIGHELMR
jgi:phosphatidylserine/phosphatidylglycerophosphate/cardiolipin synthase-like enzyme